MKVNVLGIVKGVAELAVSAGAGVVVGNLVKATTPYDLNKFQKVLVGIGGYAIGGVLGDLSAKHISNQIDKYAENLSSIIHPSEETQEAAENVKDEVAELSDDAVAVLKDTSEVGQAVAKDIKKDRDPNQISDDHK